MRRFEVLLIIVACGVIGYVIGAALVELLDWLTE